MLRKLLSILEKQETEGLFYYSIVVVDNDRYESARQTAELFALQSMISINYYVEPEQNISLARNMAIKNAKSDFIGFIDDDEFPVGKWLLNLYRAIELNKADGILGPVLPHFEKEPPKWILKGRFFDRPIHSTGYVLGWENTRTGNALLRRALFINDIKWFDPVFGSGGEDRDFFKRRIEGGNIFVWCNEAVVFETIPPARWKRKVLLKRALLRGKMALNTTGSNSKNVIKSIFAIFLYTCCLPMFFLLGQHIFMKYLIKDCDHIGKVFAFLGIDLLKEKYVSG